MSANDIAEFDATGMLIVYPAVCVKVNHAFHAHKVGLSAYNCVGITLFVSTQGCGRPQITDGQQVDTHVFCCVVKQKQIKNPEFGYQWQRRHGNMDNKSSKNCRKQTLIMGTALFFVLLAVLFCVVETICHIDCNTTNFNYVGIASVLATLAGAMLVFSTLEIQRKTLEEEKMKFESSRFDSRFYQILSSFRTDASNMEIAGDHISPKGIGVRSTYIGELAFRAVTSMTKILMKCLNDESFNDFNKEDFDIVMKQYDQIFEALDDDYYFNEVEIEKVSIEKREFIKSTQGAYLIHKMGIDKQERESFRLFETQEKENFVLEKLIGYQSSTLRKYILSLRFIIKVAKEAIDDSERKTYYSHISCLLGKEEQNFLYCFSEFDVITKSIE